MVEPISEIVDENENGIRPVIVKFQNSDVQEGEETKLSTGIYKNSAQTVVTAATKEILYTGNINRAENSNNPNNRFLLICNKKTGKVRLVAVDLAVLAPQLKQKQSDIVDDTNFNVSSMNKLNKEFGSKRIKRITEQKERLKIDVNDVKEQLEQTVAGTDVGDLDSFTFQPNENESLYRPPINRDAATNEQVYVLNEIVSEEILNSLENEANSVLSSDLTQFDTHPFIKQHLHELQDLSIPNKLKKCELLLYIDYLINFINKPAKSITKKFVICESSKEVNNHILDNFSVTSNTGRTRPLSFKNKAICYILVLSMIALDYEVDIEAISKSLKVGVKKLQEIGRILAFSRHAKKKNVMVLKLPLPPAVSLSPKKRRK